VRPHPSQPNLRSPAQTRDPTRKRQVAHPHPVALFDLQRPATAPPTTPGRSEHFHLELDPPAVVDHAGHGHSLDPEKTASVIPASAVPPRSASSTTRSLRRAACLYPASTPLAQQDPTFQPAQRGQI